ncbi:MAG TPA: amidohydrolase [Planctomycetota bacterium]|nr:amidohydrolase [Planctomycetota bacterium]
MNRALLAILVLATGCATPEAPRSQLSAPDDLDVAVTSAAGAELASLLTLYKWFHANPELSLKEEKTAAKFAQEVREAGWTVTEKIGGTGVVAVLRNGEGPTILARIDMDGLPVKEDTGLPYASSNGAMHACGHDTHLAMGIGLARILSRLKDRWSGTAILIGQPGEEVGLGAKMMIDDPKFAAAIPSKPAAVLAIHDTPAFPAGTLALCPGYASANADSVDITIFGRGGHGAWPHNTIDPVVIAAETVMALQTIVSRKINPAETRAVVTVGSIHGGSKHNIIPDEVKLQLTVRSYEDSTREKLLAEIRHIAEKTAELHHAPRPPEVRVQDNGFPAVYHDPALTERMRSVFSRLLGPDRVRAQSPAMGAEDFGRFAKHFDVPGLQFNVGAAPAAWGDGPRPGLHSNRWAPDPEPTLRAGTAAFVRGCLDLLGRR